MKNTIVIPKRNWQREIPVAVDLAGPETVIIVDSPVLKELTLIAALRAGKEVKVEIEAE